MVDISSLNPGDQVKIVDRWVKSADGIMKWNELGRMDKYLGTMMTVVGFADEDCDSLRMAEDQGDWWWYPEMLDCVVSQEELIPASETELMDMLLGGK